MQNEVLKEDCKDIIRLESYFNKNLIHFSEMSIAGAEGKPGLAQSYDFV
jgi:hypothetical protein